MPLYFILPDQHYIFITHYDVTYYRTMHLQNVINEQINVLYSGV